MNRNRTGAKGNNILYVLLFAAALLVIIAVLCRMVLFNVKSIDVNENNPYTAASVIAACRLKLGENILGMDFVKKQQLALESLPYAESVVIRVLSPSKLGITVTPAKEKILLQNGSGGGFIVSDKGKVLGIVTDISANNVNPLLLRVVGYNSAGAEIGKMLPDVTEGVDFKEILLGLVDLIDNTFGSARIKQVDLTDYLNILLFYDDRQELPPEQKLSQQQGLPSRIEIRIGSYSDVKEKLRNAFAVIQDEVGADETGIVRAGNSLEKASFEPVHG